MRDPENIRRIDLSGADWMGFVFYPPLLKGKEANEMLFNVLSFGVLRANNKVSFPTYFSSFEWF